ncbi:ABC transporter ATP-binding protein [Rhodobacteraceae bacterium LMO-12]|nr:ABC transporter ATP-binding protein [Rhodobacteraceae bacterium LMO-JJ12]
MIVLENVSKHYGNVAALNTTNIEVERGEFVTLLGSSGSGKTTLLNVVAGMVSPSSGRVLIDGKDMTFVPPNQRNIGMVFQNYALMPHMTIFENIAFPLEIRGMSKEKIRKRVGEVLDIIQLPEVASRKPNELSGGQQQRISLARCIAYNPSVVLMDEPLGALDRRLREQMQLEIKKIQTELKITMLYVTHDQEEALSMSDRIVLMEKGDIVQVGSPRDLYFQPQSEFAATFLGTSNILRGRMEAGDNAAVLETGERIEFPQPMADGSGAVTLLVRPENICLDTSLGAEPSNVLKGVLKLSVMLGATTMHYVDRPDGSTVVAEELTLHHRSPLPPGSEVTLSWNPAATIAIAGHG